MKYCPGKAIALPIRSIYPKMPKNASKVIKNKKNNNKNLPKNQVSDSLHMLQRPVNIVKKTKPTAPVAGFTMSKCALKYALSISSPFHPSARGACLPTYPSPPSQKITSYTRFIASIGTQGYGFVAISPCLAKDSICAFYSGSLYASTVASPLSANNTLSTGVVPVYPSNLPYQAVDLFNTYTSGSQGVTGRIVSVGLRVSYVGTTLNESGVIYLYSDPIHQSALAVANSPALAGGLSTTQVSTFTRDLFETVLFPISTQETTYDLLPNFGLEMIYPYSSGLSAINGPYTYANAIGGNVGICPSVVQFTGVAGSSVLVELIQHVEYTGTLATAMLTPSDADQRGFELVTAAAERLPELKNNNPRADTFDLIKEGIFAVAQALKPVALKAITAATVAAFL